MPANARAEAERWFNQQGLPYFVEETRQVVARRSAPSRTAPVIGLALLIAIGAGGALLRIPWLPKYDILVASSQLFLVLVLTYAALALRVFPIATWAIKRTLNSLSLLLPLVTRALPLLLLFVTFLFINTEVWQVAARLDGRVMWLTILLFTGLEVAFLLVRLPEELEGHDRQMGATEIREICQETPFAAVADASTDELLDDDTAPLERLERANLLLVLLIAQFVQVFLLAVSVFVFFLVFGIVAMHPDVLASWLGQSDQLHPILGRDWFSVELVQVSVFLATFSGLYFTVYAVSDAAYRDHFFTQILAELRRALAARAAYRCLLAERPGESAD